MDREHLQHFRGIIDESARVLRQYAKLFFWLSTTLILPLCFMLLAHHLVSGPLVHKIRYDERYIETHEGTPDADRKEADLAGEWASLLAFFVGYLLFVLAFSLLSTSAIVYSVACIYTEKTVSYSKVLGVVPTVWKRLLITFLWVFIIIAAYHFVSIFSIHMAARGLANSNAFLFLLVVCILAIAFIVLHVYISCVWHLASVISVLEESFGIAAIKRSFNLIRGKRTVAFLLFSSYLFLGGVIGILFHFYVLHHKGAIFRMVVGSILVTFLSFLTLFGMVAQTVFYFACKSYHNEQIDWAALSEHLGAYMGEYVPLKSTIQMEPL